MYKRQPTVIGIVLIAAAILFAITTYRQQAQDKSQPQQDEATVIKRGQITEKEREYSKEFSKLYEYRKGRKLSEISEIGKRKGNTKEITVSLGIPTIPTIGNQPIITESEFFRDLSCKSDAIVMGSVINKSAHLTEDETFVYTEYEFLPESVLKNNSVSPIKINKSIEITRPGGLIKLDNQVIRVEDQLYSPLETKKQYLLFLKFIPSANGYTISDVKGDFLLEENSSKKLSRLGLPENIERRNDTQTLLTNVKNSALSNCSMNTKEEK